MEATIRALFTMLKKSLNISRTNMRREEDNQKLPLHLPAGRHLCPQQQEDAGLAQREP
jgi:hypothetical protein